MDPLDSLYRWGERVRDRARVLSFLRYLRGRLYEDRLMDSAAALSYTTAFALVPLVMVAFGVVSAFPSFAEWNARLQDYVIANFAPGAADAIRRYLQRVTENIGTLTTAAARVPPADRIEADANCAEPANVTIDITTGATRPITGRASTPKEIPKPRTAIENGTTLRAPVSASP